MDAGGPEDLPGARPRRCGKQYDTYEPLPGLHVNGAFTMGENIADNAGIAIALKAYHISLGGKPAPVIDGFTGDQRFYLGFGQIWRGKLRDGALRQQVLSNEHSPPMQRAIGATRNQDEWYDGVRREAGRQVLPAARPARASLVTCTGRRGEPRGALFLHRGTST